ncbi:hypothetical protein PWT90_07124 [Aphanocladium album]|nr:hypothetical protein PWT90_07124 [Aphanocladium album]
MARFVNLEAEDDGGDAQDPSSSGHSTAQNLHGAAPPPAEACPTAAESMTPTVCNAVTRAFQCYPIVVGVVSHIDLTTLDSLARASRLIHYGLVQYRSALIASTLRCSNENVPFDTEETLRYRAARANFGGDTYMDASRYAADAGKASLCARDMVGECRRCAAVICRNCAIKPPASSTLRERHRRLCAPCTKAPLEKVACPSLDMSLPRSNDMMQHSLCDCEKGGVWLCQPCGRTIRSADHDYIRIWRWRNHYGEVLGCLGTGIGDADRGVICGREEHCLAAREREQEIDCDAEDARSSRTPSDHHPTTPPSVGSAYHGQHFGGSYFPVVASSSSSSSSPAGGSIEAMVEEEAAAAAAARARTPSPLLLGPGYERHEIEGIGGIVKRKLVRMVRVGKCVPEWEEERSSSRVLGREARGEARSWCGWCWRVVPGRDDLLLPKDKMRALPLRPMQTATAAKTQSRPLLAPMAVPARS